MRSKVSKKDHRPNQLNLQLQRFVGLLESYNRKLPHPRSKKNYPFLQHFFTQFVMDQNKRALEISSPSYEKIKKLANDQFPIKTLWNLCIDGRVLSILAHGASAGVGNSVRIPGGMLKEFVRGKDGKLKLEANSEFAVLLRKALTEAKNGVLAEVFDSHIGCVARAAEEELKGKFPSDNGLLADISHKMQMADAAIIFTKENFGDSKKLMVILTSFNPHSGFLYMGLETKDALLYAYRRGNEYTLEILNNLAELGKIISTEHLMAEEDIRSIFQKHKFKLDWKEHYVRSARLFWEAISSMKKTVMPVIAKKLINIYPHLAKNDSLSKIELEEKAVLLLTNAFAGYLHNAGGKTRLHQYPYGIHKEEGVKVGEGGYPPYNISTFSVFSFEEKDLPTSVQLASSLVRINRKAERVIDGSKSFIDVLGFTQAVVPLLVVEIVRDDLSEKEWQNFLTVDWKDMPENWDTINDEAFYTYLKNKGISKFGLALAISNLRHKLSVMYEMHSPISSRLIEHYAVALPMIAGQNRRIRAIIPFVKLGFS